MRRRELAESTASFVVLQSVPRPRPTTNPYVTQLWTSLRAAGVDVRPFSWRTALLGRYDVFHVHWPENLVRSHARWRTLARQLLMMALLVRIGLGRTPVVRTLHNLRGHEESGRVEALLLDWLDRLTTVRILINGESATPQGVAARVILHGHYREWFGDVPLPVRREGRLAYFGLVRAYKGVEDLISAFRGLDDPRLSLTVSGSPRTEDLATDLRRLADGDERIVLELSYVSDEQLVQRVGESELVVLPYRTMFNSGAALAALSMNRPVLVPASPTSAALSQEVGPGWVFTFSGELSPEDLAEALRLARDPSRSATPDLSAREWATAGDQHRLAYLQSLRLRRRDRLRSD